MIVVFASDVVVRVALVDFVLFKEKGLLVQIFLEDGFYAFKGVGRDPQRSGAGGFEAVRRVAFTQAHDAEAGSETLLRVGFALKDGAEEPLCIWAIFLCPLEDSGGGPLKISLVTLGLVLVRGCEAALAVVSLVAGDSLVLEQDLDGGGG